MENACDLAQRLRSVGIDVVLADVVDTGTIGIYRQRLPDLVVVTLRLPLAAARRRASSRPVYLTAQEFEDLHAAAQNDDLRADAVLDVEDLAPDEQTTAVMQDGTHEPAPFGNQTVYRAGSTLIKAPTNSWSRQRTTLHRARSIFEASSPEDRDGRG